VRRPPPPQKTKTKKKKKKKKKRKKKKKEEDKKLKVWPLGLAEPTSRPNRGGRANPKAPKPPPSCSLEVAESLPTAMGWFNYPFIYFLNSFLKFLFDFLKLILNFYYF
jgi:hypothetical protein